MAEAFLGIDGIEMKNKLLEQGKILEDLPEEEVHKLKKEINKLLGKGKLNK